MHDTIKIKKYIKNPSSQILPNLHISYRKIHIKMCNGVNVAFVFNDSMSFYIITDSIIFHCISTVTLSMKSINYP